MAHSLQLHKRHIKLHEPTFKGKVGGYDLDIYGFILTKDRICKICKEMSERPNPVIDEKAHLPCRWANKKMTGHWYKFPPELQKIYEDLRQKKK